MSHHESRLHSFQPLITLLRPSGSPGGNRVGRHDTDCPQNSFSRLLKTAANYAERRRNRLRHFCKSMTVRALHQRKKRSSQG